MRRKSLESRTLGPLPLLLQISRAIRLTETIDEMVSWDRTRCRLSPGRRIEALVLNILCGRTPLYRVTEFYEDTATGVLFGQEIESEHFSDDCLARALDKLAESKPRAVYSAVAMRACMIEGIDRQFGHFDTTSTCSTVNTPNSAPTISSWCGAALAGAKQKILLPGKRWSARPIGKLLIDLVVGGPAVARLGSGPWMISSPPHMAARAKEVVRLAGFGFDALYTGIAPPGLPQISAVSGVTRERPAIV